MDEHDDFRRIAYERAALIDNLRELGAVDLDVVRGAGFASQPTVIRKAHRGGGGGQYIGSTDAYWQLDGHAKRNH